MNVILSLMVTVAVLRTAYGCTVHDASTINASTINASTITIPDQPCQINLPDHGSTSQNTVFSPTPTCDGDSCTIPHGTTATLDLTSSCGQFSAHGSAVSSHLTGDSAQTGINGNCIGFDDDAWWGPGNWVRGVDYQPTSFSVHCDNGKLSINFKGSRQPFTRPSAGPDIFDGSLTGVESIQCHSCSPYGARDVDITIQDGIFDPACGSPSGGERVCTLTNGGKSFLGPVTELVYDTSCTEDRVRIVGSSLDAIGGFDSAGYPETFPQVYHFQGTCVTLDMDAGSWGGEDENAMGLTFINVLDQKITMANWIGLAHAYFYGDYTTGAGAGNPGGDSASGKTQVLISITGIKKIECCTCPSHENSST